MKKDKRYDYTVKYNKNELQGTQRSRCVYQEEGNNIDMKLL